MKIGFLFPGYSSQYVGMAKDLYDESRVMQEDFDEASSCLDINFIKLCFASSDAELSKMQHANPALFLTGVAIAHLLKAEGIMPDAVAGFGVGELSAIASAGGLSLPDGLYMLSKFSEIYQEALGSWNVRAVSVKNVESPLVKKICTDASTDSEKASIGFYIAGNHTIIVGDNPAIDRALEALKEHDAVVKDYPIAAGLHSDRMDSVVVHFTKYLEKVDFKDVAIPVIASVDAKETLEGEMLKRRYIKQLQAPIHWNKVMEACADWDVIVQIGPGAMLADLAKATYPNKKVISINKLDDVQELSALVQPAEEN